MVRHTWWDSEDVPVLLEALQNDQGFEGVDEYDPLGDDHSLLPEKSERVTVMRAAPEAPAGFKSPGEVTVQRWTTERKEIHITTREPAILKLRLLDYPAWRVKVNEAVVVPDKQEKPPRSPCRWPLAGHRWRCVSFERQIALLEQ